MSLPNFTVTNQVSNEPKDGSVVVDGWIIRWNTNGEGRLVVNLHDQDDTIIKNLIITEK